MVCLHMNRKITKWKSKIRIWVSDQPSNYYADSHMYLIYPTLLTDLINDHEKCELS